MSPKWCVRQTLKSLISDISEVVRWHFLIKIVEEIEVNIENVSPP